jgi:hypothetical protein
LEQNLTCLGSSSSQQTVTNNLQNNLQGVAQSSTGWSPGFSFNYDTTDLNQTLNSTATGIVSTVQQCATNFNLNQEVLAEGNNNSLSNIQANQSTVLTSNCVFQSQSLSNVTQTINNAISGLASNSTSLGISASIEVINNVNILN